MKLTQAKALSALDDAFGEQLKTLFRVRVEAQIDSPAPADQAKADQRFTNGLKYSLATYDDTFEIIKREVPE
jgi:hypothetical protein